MKVCQMCRSEADDRAQVCPNCRTVFSGTEAARAQARRRAWRVRLIVAAVVAVLIGFGVWMNANAVDDSKDKARDHWCEVVPDQPDCP